MQDKKFAFESDEISFAFTVRAGLGDTIIAKKILSAFIELVPNCVVDLLCMAPKHKVFAEAFYADIKNVNQILPRDEQNQKNIKKYDLAFYLAGSWGIIFEHANVQKLQATVPEFLQVVAKIDKYNQENIFKIGSSNAVSLRNYAMSKILNKNFFEILSCNGLLPIRDSKINIPLKPEYKSQFDALKLGRYITIYSDIERNIAPPKVKTWPIQYLREYVARMKKRRPDIAIIQCGGGVDIEIENVDRHFLGCNLELTKYILANSLLHVGCEGGLVHLATALSTKCLVLFGFTDVHYHGYRQNINLVSDVCYPCANVWGNCVTRFCGRGAVEPPCMLSLTPQLVCEVTCNYLKNNA